MNGYAFEAEMQPDGSYNVAISGVKYHCKDWNDVTATYKKHMDHKSNGSEENHAEIQGNVH